MHGTWFHFISDAMDNYYSFKNKPNAFQHTTDEKFNHPPGQNGICINNIFGLKMRVISDLELIFSKSLCAKSFNFNLKFETKSNKKSPKRIIFYVEGAQHQFNKN